MLVVSQISKELKQYHEVEELEDVRVIRDRQTSMRLSGPCKDRSQLIRSRGFAGIRVFEILVS